MNDEDEDISQHICRVQRLFFCETVIYDGRISVFTLADDDEEKFDFVLCHSSSFAHNPY